MADQRKNQNARNETKATREDSVAVSDSGPDILERVHGYVQFGLKIEGNDKFWEGVVTVNKDVAVNITDPETGKPVKIMFRAGEESICGFGVLQKLVLKSTQEGSKDMRHDWNAIGETAVKKPLKVTIVSEGISAASPAAYGQQLRIPTP